MKRKYYVYRNKIWNEGKKLKPEGVYVWRGYVA